MRRALAIAERRFGPEHSATAGAFAGLSRILLDRGRLDEAERAIRRARDIGERPSGPGLMFNRGPLADVLIRQRRFVEAETELLRGIAIADKGGIQPGHPQYQHLLRALVEVYDSLGRKQDAARYRSRLVPAAK